MLHIISLDEFLHIFQRLLGRLIVNQLQCALSNVGFFYPALIVSVPLQRSFSRRLDSDDLLLSWGLECNF